MKFSVKDILSRTYADVLVVVAFLLIGFFYFQTPIVGDMVLGGHDNDQPVGVNQDVIQHREATGETARWTNSIFGGMPTYQISPRTSLPTRCLGCPRHMVWALRVYSIMCSSTSLAFIF